MTRRCVWWLCMVGALGIVATACGEDTSSDDADGASADASTIDASGGQRPDSTVYPVHPDGGNDDTGPGDSTASDGPDVTNRLTLQVIPDDTSPLAAAVSGGLFACWITDDEVWRDIIVPRLVASRPGNIRMCTCTLPAFDAFDPPEPGSQAFGDARWCIQSQLQSVEPLLDAGWTFSSALGAMPRWLSSRPDNELTHPHGDWFTAWSLSPPSDWEMWAELVRWYVGVFAEAGVHPHYGVWDEPEWMFLGSEADYLQLYTVTSIAIKQADPLARVGGPAVSNFNQPNNNYDDAWNLISQEDRPLMEALIEHVGQTPAPELGADHLPLDFIDFHFPEPHGFGALMSRLREMLSHNGLDPDLPLRIGEWSYAPWGGPASADSTSATYMVGMLMAMAETLEDRNPILHNHTSLYDQAGWTDGGWTHVGFVSSFNWQTRPWGVVRPKLNLYQMLGHLGAERVGIKPSESQPQPLSRTLATRRADGSWAILLARSLTFAGLSDQLEEVWVRMQADEGLTQGEVASMQTQLQQCITDHPEGAAALRRVDTVEALAPVLASCFPGVEEAVVSTLARVWLAVQSDLSTQARSAWQGAVVLPWPHERAPTITVYRIDETHGNACGYNRQSASTVTEQAPCGTDGIIDRDWAEAMAAVIAQAGESLQQGGWSAEQAALAETALDDCRGGERTQDIVGCLGEFLEAQAAALPATAQDDLADAMSLLSDELMLREQALRDALNARPEVALLPAEALPSEHNEGFLRVEIDLPPEAVMLVVVE